MEKSEMEKKIKEDEDFINAVKFQNSLNKFLSKNDNPLENLAIARLLLLTSEQVEAIYQESVTKLRNYLISGED